MPEGKIIKALSGFYYVLSGDETIQCRGRGVFRKQKVTPLVGDEVTFQAENDKEGYVLGLEERKNSLVRPPIANVDQAILVFSAVEPTFSTTLLDRFLVLVESHDIEPIICITKLDLLLEEQKKELDVFVSDYREIGYEVLLTSTLDENSVQMLLPYLKDKVTVVAGQSGVGKSSLLNVLDPSLSLKTDDISTSLGRGKHTTRHVELLSIGGGFVADTPGFSSLEFTELEAEELPYCFPEMVQVSEGCKFRGCLHVKEPKCAVKEAVENGEIPSYRYDHYLSFLDEIKQRKPRY
ncbi:ribosome small subunit-dependent GTPase A [Priestia filamentosa]|uniref:Small ribosomal subunit biogenesis GTPase RsgA n=1 Tax=Priestia filamentosa TaxID=1402861 RepID=A0A1X7D4Y0_9BACI|nr:ribosome small subunit-dependent GTPase A [Priestia filamentosa]AKO93884.1 ribosome small subunit-dependent GTPase A [Priestia filamentosa]MDT3764124.1 ribosome small subunit-dependent GTPase A [Priestia filamentosa]OXS71403.1 ribosome small subunit-dependent GTPase A [Priestia filamentosa]WRU94516.1 ribosome small subunit-dependent GTPase A [Priestia filamentosa]SMF08994.1 ribosome biogenesis GTPase [Priestia filamentosa]